MTLDNISENIMKCAAKNNQYLSTESRPMNFTKLIALTCGTFISSWIVFHSQCLLQ